MRHRGQVSGARDMNMNINVWAENRGFDTAILVLYKPAKRREFRWGTSHFDIRLSNCRMANYWDGSLSRLHGSHDLGVGVQSKAKGVRVHVRFSYQRTN